MEYRKAFSFLCFFNLVSFLSVSISFGQSPLKLRSVASLYPLQEFVRAVGGERVQADLLIPPGAEPHTWEPKPSDLTKVYQADVFIYIGPAMEPWVEDILRAAKTTHLKVVQASQGLPLLDVRDSEWETQHSSRKGQEKKADPHIWLDFFLDQKIIDVIAAAFAEKDPGNTSLYRANAISYKEKLNALDRKYQAYLSKCRYRRIILGGHSAFAYLAKRYGLQQIALYGVSPNAEPTPKKLSEVIQVAKKQGAKVIYFEELVNPKLARVLAIEAGMSTLVLNPGANVTKEQLKKKVSFLHLMEMNLENLRRGLECE